MNYKERYLEEKGYLKGLAVSITSKKHEYKDSQRNEGGSFVEFSTTYKLLRELRKLQYEYRSHHIAYSIRKKVRLPLDNGELTEEATQRYNQIERIVRDGNEPNWDYIREILETYPIVPEVADEEAVCANS